MKASLKYAANTNCAADAPTDAPTETPTATVFENHIADDGKMVRERILDTAKSIITGEREEQYGHPEDNFKIIAEFWKSYLENRCVSSNGSIALYPKDVAIMRCLIVSKGWNR